ncbi:hypothetical protein NKI48_28290 [Mesorhizobium sp. M0644]|uniref:hypothetical protein n=1 Tax=Mesorhizobium sp. M0814 TaxID=2957004 RepID=UPI00333D612C
MRLAFDKYLRFQSRVDKCFAGFRCRLADLGAANASAAISDNGALRAGHFSLLRQ